MASSVWNSFHVTCMESDGLCISCVCVCVCD